MSDRNSRGSRLTVLALFDEQAMFRPEAVAIEQGGAFLSYGELARRSGHLADHLGRLGVGPEAIVGLCLERSLELVVGLLGIWKARAAYLPLDPAYPAERLGFMVADSGTRIVLTLSTFGERLPERVSRVYLDQGLDLPAAALAALPDPSHLAYVIYTSGSTGTPKGVMVDHAALANFVAGAAAEGEITAADRLLQFASISFDASADELFPCLGSGAALVLREEGMTGSFSGFLEAAGRLDITVLSLPTAYWHGLSAELAQGPRLPSSVRLVLFGGEEAQAASLSAWRERVGDGVRLLNSYGPTEATVVTTRADLTAWRGESGDPLPIGRPVAGAHTWLLGAEMAALPPGEEGELWIGGAGLARGYLGRPGLTAERFRPDPFAVAGQGGDRLYRTGDLARQLADGNLVFRGRVDGQVKVRGFRIELGEIEAVLCRLPGVREAAAVVQEDGMGERRLAAFIVSGAPGAAGLDTGELRERLRALLPEHMVPSVLILLPELPLTTSEKVDRAALATLLTRPADRGDDAAAPRSPVEEVLAGIWSELLSVARVSLDDDFFALGGHSLLVAQALSRIRQTLGVEVPLVEFFNRPTVAEVARLVEQVGQGGAAGPPELPPIRPVPREGRPLPLSFAQERVWFLDQLAQGGNLAYNFQVALRLFGPLDVAVLERTLTEIVRRHEVLRTSFPSIDDRPVQIVQPARPIVLPVVDFGHLSPEEGRARSEELIERLVQIPFDVSQGPLIRWRLLRHGERSHTLVQVEHHFVHDGWSLAVLFRELEAIYEAFSRGEPSPLPELPVQYADYAVWQREWMEGEVMDGLLGYWKAQLAGSPEALEIATDRPRPPQGSFRGDLLLLPIDPDLYESLRRFGRKQGFTLYMTMLAGFLSLLHRYTGEEDVVIGTSNANRRAREIEGMIGMVVNSLVLRADLMGRPSFRELLGRVRALSLEIYAHQDMPFERLVQELRFERRPGRNPLFQLMFNFLDAPLPDFRFGDLEMLPDLRHNRTAKMDMNLVVVPRAEQRVGRGEDAENRRATLDWEYNTDLFDAVTVRRMAAHYQTLLTAAVADPDLALPELPLLSPAEQAELLQTANATATDYPRQGSILERFAVWAERTPGAPAVLCGEESLTYGELAERAYRLAWHLRGLGAGPGELVALAALRSLDLVPAILGILASGAAYVPLDPGYPPERLAWMLADSGARFLVCQEELLPRLPPAEGEIHRVVLERDREAIAAAPATLPATAPEPPPGPDDLAYVMYTSGSTGRPKGVAVTHRNVVRLVFGSGFARFGPEEVFLQLAPISFDASTLELWGPLLHGGRLALFPPERPSLESLGEALAWYGVTTLWLTAGLFHQMVEGNPDGLRPLSQLLAGGDVLSPAHVRRALEALPGLTLINGYGPTEGTTFTCCHPMTDPREVGASVPIGRPIGNARVYVVDAELRPLPAGVPGELLIGGDGLALGYLHQPGLTAERFVPDPFGTAPGGRLYRTGDRVRSRPEGILDFLGRLDQQVKIRGYRIEPGEIEAVLVEHPAVGEVAVLAEPEPGTEERRLVAYVAPRPEQAGADLADLAPSLRLHLAAKLPAHMVPAAFRVLPALPLTENGKVDRRALARLAPETPAAGWEFAPPGTAMEVAIAAIWREVLGIERVGTGDDFFDLGGHSLSAARVLSRLRREHGVELPLGALFEYSTLAGLAARATEVTAAVPSRVDRSLPFPAASLADSLSDDQLDRLLGEMLAEEEGH